MGKRATTNVSVSHDTVGVKVAVELVFAGSSSETKDKEGQDGNDCYATGDGASDDSRVVRAGSATYARTDRGGDDLGNGAGNIDDGALGVRRAKGDVVKGRNTREGVRTYGTIVSTSEVNEDGTTVVVGVAVEVGEVVDPFEEDGVVGDSADGVGVGLGDEVVGVEEEVVVEEAGELGATDGLEVLDADVGGSLALGRGAE